MCILQYYPSHTQPVRDHLVTSCENNPHGFGWAIIVGDVIMTGHSMDAGEAIEEFIHCRAEYPQGDALFHARITTHGTTSLDNCHPFYINGRSDMVLAHNGMLPCQPKPGDRRSDTRIFAEEVIMRDFRRLDREKVIKRLSSWVGYSKVLILSTNPAYKQSAYLINSQMGHWSEAGVWYSNDSYREDPWAKYCCDDTTWFWPESNTLGKARSTYDDDDMWVCIGPNGGCGRTMDWCDCVTPVFGVRRMAGLYETAKEDHRETDDPDTWFCRGCKMVGWVSSLTLKCNMCKYMYCCDMPQSACQCWDPDDTMESRRRAVDAFTHELNTFRLSGSEDIALPALSDRPHNAGEAL